MDNYSFAEEKYLFLKDLSKKYNKLIVVANENNKTVYCKNCKYNVGLEHDKCSFFNKIKNVHFVEMLRDNQERIETSYYMNFVNKCYYYKENRLIFIIINKCKKILYSIFNYLFEDMSYLFKK